MISKMKQLTGVRIAGSSSVRKKRVVVDVSEGKGDSLHVWCVRWLRGCRRRRGIVWSASRERHRLSISWCEEGEEVKRTRVDGGSEATLHSVYIAIVPRFLLLLIRVSAKKLILNLTSIF